MRNRMAPEVEWRRKNSTDDESGALPVRDRSNFPDLLKDVGSNGLRPECFKTDANGETTQGGRIQRGGGDGRRGGRGEKRGTKQPVEISDSGYREIDVTSADNTCNAETQRERRRFEAVKRVLCCLGWLLCCPCWTLGFCLREQPESLEELRGDPCWPCDENTPSATLRD